MKVLSFGSINIDYTYTVDHFVRGGETQGALALQRHHGGKGLNQSVALARAGAQVYHAGKIGADGCDLLEALQHAGVSTAYVEVDEHAATGHAIIQIEQGSGQNCILTYAGTNGTIEKSYMETVVRAFSAGDIAVFQNEINDIAYAIACCRAQGMTVVLNPSPLTPQLQKAALYADVDYLFVNELEGAALSGQTEPRAICRALHAAYPRCRIVLTLGKQGALFFDGKEFLQHGIYRVKVVDTTGAGDTFSGFFMAAIARGKSPAEALELASKASSMQVERMGAAEAVPTLEEVETRQLAPL